MSILNRNLNSRPIGFFDSGVGGLSVYACFRQMLPFENTLYFGDLINMPYGNKTKSELVSYARRILDFYKEKGVKAVVIACNTSSAQAYDVVKSEYNFKIYPIIQSCAKVIGEQNYTKLGVFATQATVNSGVYTRELKKHSSDLKVFEIPCPNWVNIVESGGYNKTNSISDVKKHVEEMLTHSPQKIILGCTHYPYLLDLLKQFAPKELFIDPAKIFVEYIRDDLAISGMLNKDKELGTEQMFVSANPENFVEHSKIFYEVKELPRVV